MNAFSRDPHFLVASGKSFKLSAFDPGYTAGLDKKTEGKQDLMDDQKQLILLQEKLYAEKRHALLIIFQALDAAGKDSTVKKVLSGLNQDGCNVTKFRRPSEVELSHDFLWRTTLPLPERGWIGIYNRSYYEDVLICKVRPEHIIAQRLPGVETLRNIDENFWEKRYRSIRKFEEHLVANGTMILKFFLHVSKGEQRTRLLERIDDPEKNWKFDPNDLKEREMWDEYQRAYEEAIRETATTVAPWYVIPADHKWFMQMAVGDIIRATLEELGLEYPKPDPTMQKELERARKLLMGKKRQ